MDQPVSSELRGHRLQTRSGAQPGLARASNGSQAPQVRVAAIGSVQLRRREPPGDIAWGVSSVSLRPFTVFNRPCSTGRDTCRLIFLGACATSCIRAKICWGDSPKRKPLQHGKTGQFHRQLRKADVVLLARSCECGLPRPDTRALPPLPVLLVEKERSPSSVVLFTQRGPSRNRSGSPRPRRPWKRTTRDPWADTEWIGIDTRHPGCARRPEGPPGSGQRLRNNWCHRCRSQRRLSTQSRSTW